MDAVAVMEMRLDGGMPAPSSGWLVQGRSTKPVEEVSAPVGSGKIYVAKTAVAAGAGNKTAVAAGAGNKVEAGKIEPAGTAGGKKRTKTVRVHQEFIDGILKDYPFTPFPGEPEELEKNIKDPAARERLRVMLAPVTAIMRESRGKHEAIIKQYLAQGYAEEEVEVSDDDQA